MVEASRFTPNTIEMALQGLSAFSGGARLLGRHYLD
jgi:hypothetical protein